MSYLCKTCGMEADTFGLFSKHTCPTQTLETVRASQVVALLEKISRAIRDLEGLPVSYHLAKKLSDVQRTIAEECQP